jgi:hypothetical protein
VRIELAIRFLECPIGSGRETPGPHPGALFRLTSEVQSAAAGRHHGRRNTGWIAPVIRADREGDSGGGLTGGSSATGSENNAGGRREAA